MEQEQLNEKNSNVDILGYYVEDSIIVLELKLTNVPDVEEPVVGVGFNKHFVKWMLEEFDVWHTREENQVEEEE